MKFEHTEVTGCAAAIRGMRNPMDSHAKSDSNYCRNIDNDAFRIGAQDMELAGRLIAAGAEHRKFLRFINVSVDITAPLYWWKEMDTYKIGTSSNSESTMHRLASTPITMECFETDDFCDAVLEEYQNQDGRVVSKFTVGDAWEDIITNCELLRQLYNDTKDKRYWKELIRMLPESWLQKRTWSANYEVLRGICRQRKGHKLTEWAQYIEWASSLPYANEFILEDEGGVA